MANTPGTVSKILWHFTGGPMWDDVANKQAKQLKPTQAGYDALKSILESKELRVGRYKELIKVILPTHKVRNKTTKKIETVTDYPVIIHSSPVCCVADIPLQHLDYHANRYGKIAIGFYRNSIVKSGFNPVMYTLENSTFGRIVHDAYSLINNVDASWAQSELQSELSDVNDVLGSSNLDEVDFWSTESALDDIESAVNSAIKKYGEIISYVKTFDESEFDSIYCEREWRSVENFPFSWEDVAMVVLPKNHKEGDFYKMFIDEELVPRDIPVICWEDLLEH